ncbi:ras-related protein Rab-21-like [Argonauta hians]
MEGSETEPFKSLEAKIVLLGSQAVGKTSLIIRYVGGIFSKHVSPTIGASFFTHKLTVDKYRIKLQVWDTAGQERFRSMAPMYYRNANAALLMYDITCKDSYYEIKDWVKELKKNVDTPIVMCLLGNKQDLEHQRKVSMAEAQQYANSIGAYFFETSALFNTGIEETFLKLAQQLVVLADKPNSGLKIRNSISYEPTESGQTVQLDNKPKSGQEAADCSC